MASVHLEPGAVRTRIHFEGIEHADGEVAREMHDVVMSFEPDGEPIIVDFTGLETICSGILGMVIVLRKRAEEAGSSVAVVAPAEPIRRLFRVSGVRRDVRVYPDWADAEFEQSEPDGPFT